MQSTVLGFSPWMGHARSSPHGLCGLPPPFDNGRVKSKGGVFSGNSIRASVPHLGNRLHLSAFGYYADSWKSVSDIKLKASPLFLVRADARPDSGGGESSAASTKLKRTLELGFLFALWYLFNIYFNVYNKQVLKVYPLPATLTAVQFGVGSVLVTLMWILRMYKSHRISWSQLLAILPLAVVHTLGNLFTNMSLGKVAVSFTHTIKAMEPFFSVVLSSLFLHDSPSLWVLFSLVPIVGGVALASVTEASFNWAGFWSAMASNVSNQSRNVLSKKVMVKKEDSLDNITLFSIMTVMSFIMMVPSAIVMDGIKFTPSYLQSLDLNLVEVSTKCLLASLCFHSYQQVSYMILQRVSPVSHSVGNCVKRVVVIVSSVLFFHTPVSPINSIGTGIALAGVFVYSQVKRIKPSPKKAA